MHTDIANPVQAIQDRRDALEKRIEREIWSEVARLISDETEYYEQRLAEIIAAHLPGVAPAVLAILDQAQNGDCEGGCCGLPQREYGWTS